MADVLVTKRTWTIQADATYILATATPDSDRPQTVIIRATSSSYDGTVTVKSRPRGLAGAWSAVAYTILSTGVLGTAAFAASSFYIKVDATGQELALDSASRTAGSLAVEVVDVVDL